MATVKIILYKQKKMKDSKHPIMLQVTHNSKASRISLKYKCVPKDWDSGKCRFKKSMENYRDKNTVLRALESKAEEAIDNIQREGLAFTPALFKEIFLDTKQEITVLKFFDLILEELQAKGSTGNYDVYKGAKNALKRYTKNKSNLMFSDINYTFLKKFETFLFKGGCTGGGVSNYMRTLRALINEAIRRKYMSKENYPFATSFNKNGYSLSHLKSEAKPRALSIEDMEKIKNFEIEKHPEFKETWLIYLFSYYCRGMNFADMAKLKWTDIYDGRIFYKRMKTGTQFSIKVNDKIQSIIDEFKPKVTPYVFPILTDFHKTPEQIKNRRKKRLRKFNQEMKKIARLLGIREDISSYMARHTYASTLNSKDVSVSKISQGLGHKDVATTQHYLKRFDNKEIDDLDELL